MGCAKARLLWIGHFEIISDKKSGLQMFFKTGDLKNSAIFTRKHLCWSLFNEVALKFFIKKRQKYFPVNIAKFLRTAFVIKHGWQFSI